MNAKWFKDKQKQVGVTADVIAQRMGRSRSNVSHILNGHQRMSLEWAEAFAEVLQVPVAEVLEQAGAAKPQVVQQLRPGFAESDAVAWEPGPGLAEGHLVQDLAKRLGGRPGVDTWRVRTHAMAQMGYLEGDYMLVDTHQAERVKAGDTVLAQVYDNTRGTAATVLRRFRPPVLVAAAAPPQDVQVNVVDGVNVVIRGKVIASWRM
jgi:transcriptional regulator with XRE-family HTH domain